MLERRAHFAHFNSITTLVVLHKVSQLVPLGLITSTFPCAQSTRFRSNNMKRKNVCCLDFTALRLLFFIDVLIIREFSSSRNNNNIIINCICFNFLRCIIYFTTWIKFNKTIKSFLFFCFQSLWLYFARKYLALFGERQMVTPEERYWGLWVMGGFKCRCRYFFILYFYYYVKWRCAIS